jgi:hypothetical protein
MSEEKKESWGAWKKQTAKGEVINFTLNGTRYSMWANAYKKDEKQPDYKIYVNDYVAPVTNNDLQPKATDLPF